MQKRYFFIFSLSIISLIVNAQTYQLPNGGFENWEGNGSSSEPTHWNSFMTASGSGLAFSLGQNQQIELSSDIRPGSTGTKSVRIFAREILGFVANGIITTGQVNLGSTTPSAPSNHTITRRAIADFNQPLTAKPDSIRFWAKFNCSNPTQMAKMNAVIHDAYDYMDPDSYDANAANHVVGKAIAEFNRENQTWQEYTAPFNYNYPATTPTNILITFATNTIAGEGNVSDELFIDDINFIYNPRLSAIYVAGSPITNFNPEITTYYDTVYGITPITTITVTTASPNANYQITQATGLNPIATIHVTHGDTSRVYYVHFTHVSSSSNFIYVAPYPYGNDNNDGTLPSPYASLQKALAFASSDSATIIKMASGLYNEQEILELNSNITIDGGYHFSDSIWEKNGEITNIFVDAIEYIDDYSHKIGFRSMGDTNWLLKDITLQIPSATVLDRAFSGKGASIYGIYISNNGNKNRIENCNILVGNGGDGVAGTSGEDGMNGNNGGAGGSGGLSPLTNSGLEVGLGGLPLGSGNRAGGAGGTGSAGGEGYHGTSINGSAGYMGGDFNGGRGGNGGEGVSYCQNGKVGSSGEKGADGITQFANSQYIWSQYFNPANQGGNGTDGFGGGGGGGGSGGGGADGTTLLINNQYCGGAGGGGGSGGSGGKGGTGGMGGGGSFGIYCYNAKTPEIVHSNITIGSYGRGGSGGSGGVGGNGGDGGSGGDCSSTGNAGKGGNGGKGGKGGNGANGEDGINGINEQIAIIINEQLVKENISLPIVRNYRFCSNDSIQISAIPGFNGNSCRWYTSITDTIPFAIDTIITPIVTVGDTLFYISTFNSINHNESFERIPVFISVNQQPTQPVVSDIFRCGIGTISLPMTIDGETTTCNWYLNADTLTPFFSGQFFSDTMEATTTYFVSNFNEITGCESPRTPLQIIIGYNSDTTFLFDTICKGEDYREFGFELIHPSASNISFLMCENKSGCDSIVKLNLTVNPITETTIFDTIQLGFPYYENGFQLENQLEEGSLFYQITLENQKGCDSTVFLYLTVDDMTIIDEKNNKNLLIYPNPTTQDITVKNLNYHTIEEIEIYDMYGKLLVKVKPNNNELKLNITDFLSGVYFLHIKENKREKTFKIIKN